jgi:hypothetical protein
MEMRVSAQGDALRSEFVSAMEIPLFPPGSYMLMMGTEVFLVNPDRQTFARMDLAGLGDMMAAADQSTEAMRQGGVEMVVENQRFEKVLEEDGGAIHGYPTRHYRYHSGFTQTMKMPVGGSFGTEVDTVDDVWTTTALELDFDPGALSSLSFGSGLGKELQELGKAEVAKMTGFPLKRVAVANHTPSGSGMMGRMMSRGGNEGPVTTTVEVFDLVQGDLPASQFEIPAGYSEVELLQIGSPGPAMPDLGEIEEK